MGVQIFQTYFINRFKVQDEGNHSSLTSIAIYYRRYLIQMNGNSSSYIMNIHKRNLSGNFPILLKFHTLNIEDSTSIECISLLKLFFRILHVSHFPLTSILSVSQSFQRTLFVGLKFCYDQFRFVS